LKQARGVTLGGVRKADQREAAEMLRRILDAVDRGELTADTPEERCNVRRLEGMLAAMEHRVAPGDGRPGTARQG
jgi:hypothetical protein